MALGCSPECHWNQIISKIFIPVKLFQKLSTDLAEEVVKSLFLFIALAAILFNVVKSFEQFW